MGYLGHSAFVTQGGDIVDKGPGAERSLQWCVWGVNKEQSGAPSADRKVINLPWGLGAPSVTSVRETRL